MEKTKTKFRPILFSTPMVQALTEGRKTMTRRVVKPQPESIDFYEDRNVWFPEVSKCPYEVSDVLWVRETFLPLQVVDAFDKEQILYKASSGSESFIKAIHKKWKPSLFMPKEACRIFLKIKSIGVERLQDISEEHCKKEGIKLTVTEKGVPVFELGVKNSPFSFLNSTKPTSLEIWKAHWASLWSSINGKESYDANPFVWVYEFERIEKPLDFN